MSRLTKAKMVAQHEAEIADLRARHEARIEAMEKDTRELKEAHRLALVDERRQTFVEQQTRAAAQRGLTPYVYAIQALNRWLQDNPDVGERLRPVMVGLGLWGVEVGYDPDKDKALSIIWAKR